MNCFVDNQSGKKISVKMGSYGIGVSRLVGAIIEAKYNNDIMKWPKSIAPFDVVIIPSLSKNNNEIRDIKNIPPYLLETRGPRSQLF